MPGERGGQSVIDVIKVSLNGLNTFLDLQKRKKKEKKKVIPSVSSTEANSFPWKHKTGRATTFTSFKGFL